MTLDQASFVALLAMFAFIAYRVECMYRAFVKCLGNTGSEAGDGK